MLILFIGKRNSGPEAEIVEEEPISR